MWGGDCGHTIYLQPTVALIKGDCHHSKTFIYSPSFTFEKPFANSDFMEGHRDRPK